MNCQNASVPARFSCRTYRTVDGNVCSYQTQNYERFPALKSLHASSYPHGSPHSHGTSRSTPQLFSSFQTNALEDRHQHGLLVVMSVVVVRLLSYQGAVKNSKKSRQSNGQMRLCRDLFFYTNFNLKVDKMKLALLCGELLVPAGASGRSLCWRGVLPRPWATA